MKHGKLSQSLSIIDFVSYLRLQSSKNIKMKVRNEYHNEKLYTPNLPNKNLEKFAILQGDRP